MNVLDATSSFSSGSNDPAAPSPGPVTLATIAQATGYSKNTVSLALRRSPRISERTRNQITATAKRLGYRRDIRLTLLMEHFRARRAQRSPETIAFLTTHPNRYGWKRDRHAHRLFNGAVSRAGELGFKVEDFWLAEPGMTAARMSQLLWTRSIAGVIVGPSPEGGEGSEPALAWDKFAAVTVGARPERAPLNWLSTDYVGALLEAGEQLRALGYRRPGLVLSPAQNDRAGLAWQAGYLLMLSHAFTSLELPIHWWQASSISPFRAWLAAHRPDCVLGLGPTAEQGLRQLGYSVPHDIGYVDLDLDPGDPGRSGIVHHAELIGAFAVDTVFKKIQSNTLGGSGSGWQSIIPGTWHGGDSTREQSA